MKKIIASKTENDISLPKSSKEFKEGMSAQKRRQAFFKTQPPIPESKFTTWTKNNDFKEFCNQKKSLQKFEATFKQGCKELGELCKSSQHEVCLLFSENKEGAGTWYNTTKEVVKIEQMGFGVKYGVRRWSLDHEKFGSKIIDVHIHPSTGEDIKKIISEKLPKDLNMQSTDMKRAIKILNRMSGPFKKEQLKSLGKGTLKEVQVVKQAILDRVLREQDVMNMISTVLPSKEDLEMQLMNKLLYEDKLNKSLNLKTCIVSEFGVTEIEISDEANECTAYEFSEKVHFFKNGNVIEINLSEEDNSYIAYEAVGEEKEYISLEKLINKDISEWPKEITTILSVPGITFKFTPFQK